MARLCWCRQEATLLPKLSEVCILNAHAALTPTLYTDEENRKVGRLQHTRATQSQTLPFSWALPNGHNVGFL